jgi:hypothetical protein
MKTEHEKLLASCVKLFDDLTSTYDLSEHSPDVHRLTKKIEKALLPAVKTKITKNWKIGLINAWKPIFDKYPKLQKLPVYAWGRYYKYELGGDPFETSAVALSDYKDSHGFCSFYLSDLKIDYKLLKEIENDILGDEEENEEEISYKKITGYYPIKRAAVAKAYGFDDRGGMCLVIERKGNKLVLNAHDCDSPE